MSRCAALECKNTAESTTRYCTDHSAAHNSIMSLRIDCSLHPDDVDFIPITSAKSLTASKNVSPMSARAKSTSSSKTGSFRSPLQLKTQSGKAVTPRGTSQRSHSAYMRRAQTPKGTSSLSRGRSPTYSDRLNKVVEKKESDAPSGFFRLKSYIYTKVAESSLGRQVIGYFVGTAGDNVFTQLQEAVSKHEGKLQSEKLGTYIIRFAIKVKLLHENRNITQKDVFHLAEPCNAFVLNLHENFKAVEEGDSRNVDIQVLNRQAMRVKNRLMSIVEPHMTAKEKAKLGWVMGLLGGNDFLDALFLSEELAQERKIIAVNLAELVEPLLEERGEENLCKYSTCKRVETQLDPPELFENFRQLHYCTKHHFKLFMNMDHSPHIDHFLTVDRKYQPFLDWVQECLPANYADFYRATGNYQVARWGQRGAFAKLLWKKYLTPDCKFPVQLEPEMIEDIKNQLSEPTVDTYTAARDYVEVIITEIFNDSWVVSEEFATYMNLLSLPEIFMTNFLKDY